MKNESGRFQDNFRDNLSEFEVYLITQLHTKMLDLRRTRLVIFYVS